MTSASILRHINDDRELRPVFFHDLTGPAYGPLLLHLHIREKRRLARPSLLQSIANLFRPLRRVAGGR
jgi:hypothetical protein